MKKILAALFLALLCLTRPARAVETKSIETDWVWDVYYASHTNVTTATDDISGFGAVGYSTRTANIIGFAYTIYADGGAGLYTVTHTTKTYSNRATVVTAAGTNTSNAPYPYNWASSTKFATEKLTTPAIGVMNGKQHDRKFEALTINPYFSWSGLSQTATYYLWVEYGHVKTP